MSFDGSKEYKLGDVCTKIGSGATPKGGKEAYLDKGEFALIRSQNVLDFTFSFEGLAFINSQQAIKLNNVALEENDVLLNITGDSVARVCQVPNEILPARVNQHVAILRPNKELLDPVYLKYYLLSSSVKKSLLTLSSGGGTRNALTKSMIENLIISAPPVIIQQRIAAILSSLDDKIELNRQTNQTLEAIVQTLFKEWFVDFNFPGSEGEMQRSELGEIPKGWKVGKLGNVTKVITGKTPSSSTSDHFGNYLPFVTPTDFRNYGKLVINSDRGVSKKGASALKNKILPVNSVIVTCIGSDMGKVAINRVPCLTNQQINSLVPDTNQITADYLYYYLVSKYDLLRSIASGGSTMPIINKTQFEEIKLLVPSTSILQTFGAVVSPFNSFLENNLLSITSLTQLRDTLLPKLMKGEITITQTEKLAAAV